MGIEPVTTRCLVAVLTTKLLGRWRTGSPERDEKTPQNPPTPCHLASARQHPENQQAYGPVTSRTKTSISDHVVLGNMISNTQENGTPETASHRKSQITAGKNPEDYRKAKLTKATCHSKITLEMRHKKIVTENGFFPKKCATSVPGSFRSPRSQANFAFTAHRGALHLLTFLVLSPQPAKPMLLPQHSSRWVKYRGTPGQIKAGAGARAALHSHRPVFFLSTQIL